MSKQWTWPVALLAGLAVALVVAFPVGLVGRDSSRRGSAVVGWPACRREPRSSAPNDGRSTCRWRRICSRRRCSPAPPPKAGWQRSAMRWAQGSDTIWQGWRRPWRPVRRWTRRGPVPPADLAPMAGVFRRSMATGAPAAPALIAVATDLASRATRGMARTRRPRRRAQCAAAWGVLPPRLRADRDRAGGRRVAARRVRLMSTPHRRSDRSPTGSPRDVSTAPGSSGFGHLDSGDRAGRCRHHQGSDTCDG